MTSPSRSIHFIWFVVAVMLVGFIAAAGMWGMIEYEGLRHLVDLNVWVAETFIERGGYWGVFALMAIESSFIPFPSEIVMPPAGALAFQREDWTLWGVILAGTAGSVVGAWINYWLAWQWGRQALLWGLERWGKYLRLSVGGYLKAEQLFYRFGGIATLIGRWIPGVRQLISIPAGLARLHPLIFTLFTAFGAGVWVALLAWLGYVFTASGDDLSEALRPYIRYFSAGAFVLAIGVMLFCRKQLLAIFRTA